MLGLGLGISKKRNIGGLNPNYKSLLEYQSNAGYTLPTDAIQALQNEMMVELKDIWPKLDGFLVFATDGDEDTYLTDWVRLEQVSQSGTVEYSLQNGVRSNGTNGYINTNWQYQDGPNTSEVSASFGFAFSTGTPDRYQCGLLSGAPGSGALHTLGLNNTSNQYFLRAASNYDESVGTSESDAEGVWVVNKPDGDNVNLYYNGTLEASAQSTSVTALADRNFFLMVHGSTYTALQFRVAFWGGELTSGEVTTVTNAINTYLTAVDTYNSEYQTVITNAESNSYGLPSVNTQLASVKLIDNLKSDGIWDKIDQLLVLCTDGDSDFSLIDWKSPGTNNASTIGSPSFTSLDGWSTDRSGSSADDAINSNWNPTDDGDQYTLSSATIGMDFVGSKSGAGFYAGTNPNPGQTRIENTNKVILNQGGEFTFTDYGSPGSMAQYSLLDGTLSVYEDGSLHQSTSYTPVALSDDDFYVLALRLNASGDVFGEPGNSVMRLYWTGAGLTAQEASDFYDHWQTYLTAIGA